MQRPRIRFTVRWLMALVSLLALGLAVIRHAVTRWGASEVMTLSLTILLTTNILAWFQGARRQVFWVGFGLCGWAYLSISLGSPLGEHLPTAWLLDGLHDQYYADHPDPAYDDGFGNGVMSPAHSDSFRRAGQSVFGLLFALLGGSVATVLIPAGTKDGFPPGGPDRTVRAAEPQEVSDKPGLYLPAQPDGMPRVAARPGRVPRPGHPR